MQEAIFGETTLKKIALFLKEYKELIEKYQMYIGACGCCGSPWLVVIKSTIKNPREIIKHLLLELHLEGDSSKETADKQ